MTSSNREERVFVKTLGLILLVTVFFSWVVIHMTYEEKLKQAQEIRSKR